jgi:hypothetical protein
MHQGELVARERQPQVCLGEALHTATENSLHLGHHHLIRMHGNHRALHEVDHQAGGLGELVEDELDLVGGGDAGLENDQGVVCILQDRARSLVGERVPQEGILLNHPLEKVTHQQVQVRRQGIPLP